MKHDASENRILISLGELVSIARRRISPALPIDEDEPELKSPSRIALASLGIKERKKLSLDFEDGGVSYRLFGYADEIQGSEITLVKSTEGGSKSVKKAEVAQARGEAFMLGKMLAESENLDSVSLRIIFPFL